VSVTNVSGIKDNEQHLLVSELRCENQDLKKENQALWEKLTNLTLIVSDIKTKSKEMENERLQSYYNDKAYANCSAP
jgi:hypothetical protein